MALFGLFGGGKKKSPFPKKKKEKVPIVDLAKRFELRARTGQGSMSKVFHAYDKKIGRIVDMLTNLKDSQSSKRRVSEVKAEAIAGLKKMLEVYKRERNAIVQQIRSDDSASAAALMKDLQAVDQLSEKRVGQIVDLVKSMPGGQDIATLVVRSEIRAGIRDACTQFTWEETYGPRRAEYEAAAEKAVQGRLEPVGIKVRTVSIRDMQSGTSNKAEQTLTVVPLPMAAPRRRSSPTRWPAVTGSTRRFASCSIPAVPSP